MIYNINKQQFIELLQQNKEGTIEIHRLIQQYFEEGFRTTWVDLPNVLVFDYYEYINLIKLFDPNNMSQWKLLHLLFSGASPIIDDEHEEFIEIMHDFICDMSENYYDLKCDHDALESEKTTLEDDISAAKDELQGEANEIANLQQELCDLENIIDEQKNEIDNLTHELDNAGCI